MSDKNGDIKIEVPAGQMRLSSSPPEVKIRPIYETLAMVASNETEAKAIERAGGIFSDAKERDLFIYAHDEEPVGPRIGVEGVAESTLKTLARYEWDRRERRNRDWKWGAALGVTIIIAITGWLN